MLLAAALTVRRARSRDSIVRPSAGGARRVRFRPPAGLSRDAQIALLRLNSSHAGIPSDGCSGDETPAAVSYTQVVTRYDEVVIPHPLGFLSGANTTNVRFQDRCPANFTEHLGINYDPVAFLGVERARAPGPGRPGVPPGLLSPNRPGASS
jgi:hypothetical protein